MREQALSSLQGYIEKEGYKGYDPYDTLLSRIPFRSMGRWIPAIAIQAQKRNPVNIRPLLGIPKDHNPKAMGLFLHAYTLLWESSGRPEYRERADFFFDWLSSNRSEGYSGACWGYNFPWANPAKNLDPYIPSSVVTGFVARGLWAYHKATGSTEAAGLISSASRFVMTDLPRYEDDTGQSISYTPVIPEICYNASLLAGEVIAMASVLERDQALSALAAELVDFVVHRQKDDGRWNYSQSADGSSERQQVDFHQGYVLESIDRIGRLTGYFPEHWNESVSRGLRFYRDEQFHAEGRSYWRLPREYPVEIHNQAQGILTFTRLRDYHDDLAEFAGIIADWTITHMQSGNGSFAYQKRRLYVNRIPYMRWNQAWMFLALATLLSGGDPF